jgi:2-methylisocitrate lyase-like PEP mutase family enzyme
MHRMMSQVECARRFRSLHDPRDPIVLYNIWDAGSALTVERAGAKAIATSSWSVAAAQGYADGERLPLEDALSVVARIARCVKLPVTIDFEGGYAAAPEAIGRNVRRLLALSVVGFNLEDQVVDGPGLYSVEDQFLRIRGAREAADSLGVPAFINARTDVFLKAAQGAAPADLLKEALVREEAYASAGADGFFVPGLKDKALIRQVCEAASLPVNVMTAVNAQEVRELAKLGVARISLGPAPYIGLASACEKDASAFY